MTESQLNFDIEDLDKNTFDREELEHTLGLVEEHLDNRDAGDQGWHTVVEAHAPSGLKSVIDAFKSSIPRCRARLKPAEKELKELEAEEQSLEHQRLRILRTMAAAGLRRVGAPHGAAKEVQYGKLKDQSLMMAAVELNADSTDFNNLYGGLREVQPDLPEWVCSAVAAQQPERDLLGMCPGGKPHMNKETLKEMKMSMCHCTICSIAAKKKVVEEKIPEVRMVVNELKETLEWSVPTLKKARKLKRRLKGDGDGDENYDDPVFYGDQTFEVEDRTQMIAHERARNEWARLESSLQVTDLPLRVAFLDKSGSMGCDQICYDALQLALFNCIHPTCGSTLTFLFAAPGETEVILRRSNDPPMSFEIHLGCATWFNEPIVRTLRFLAPLIESIDTRSWMNQHGQPPLQVLCMTDGMDNVSAQNMSSLKDVVREVKSIVGPQKQEKLYLPIAGPLQGSILDSENPKVPVWLAWIACGMGGQMLLGENQPKEIMVVDAVAAPQCRDHQALMDVQRESSSADQEQRSERQKLSVEKSTAISRSRQRISAASVPSLASTDLMAMIKGSEAEASEDTPVPLWSIGHRVRVKASQPGRAPKAAVVVAVIISQSIQYDILLDDETRATVSESELLGSPGTPTTMLKARPGQAIKQSQLTPNQGLLARTADPESQRLQVLAVVEAATQNLAAMTEAADCSPSKNAKEKKDCSAKPKSLSLEDAMKRIHGAEEVDDEVASRLSEKLQLANKALQVTSTPQPSPASPAAVLMDVLMAAGKSAAKLLPEDRQVAQRLLSVGLEMLVAGGNLVKGHLCDQLGPFVNINEANSIRRIRVEAHDLEKWQQTLALPLESILDVLIQNCLLETTQTAGFDALTATDGGRSCVMAVWRFFDPSLTRSGVEDSLRRCVNRFQRLQPAFNLVKRRSKDSVSSKGDTSASEDTQTPCSSSSGSMSSSNSSPDLMHGPRMVQKRSTVGIPDSPQRYKNMGQNLLAHLQESAPGPLVNSNSPHSRGMASMNVDNKMRQLSVGRLSRTPPSSAGSTSSARLPNLSSSRCSSNSP